MPSQTYLPCEYEALDGDLLKEVQIQIGATTRRIRDRERTIGIEHEGVTDNIAPEVAIACTNITWQLKVRHARQRYIGRSPNPSLEHTTTPDWHTSLCRHIVDLASSGQATHSTRLDIDHPTSL